MRRIAALAVPALLVAMVPAGAALTPDDVEAEASAPAPQTSAALLADRENDRVSRSRERVALPRPEPTPTATPTPEPTPTEAPEPEPKPEVVDHRYATVGLNVRVAPSRDAEVLTVLARGSKVGVTGETDGEWAQVVHDDEPAWVSAEYLATSKPEPEPEPEPSAATAASSSSGGGGGISAAECPTGSGVESGLTQDAIRVHRAVCARFPEVSSYGGLRPGDGGEHGSGRALDIMVTGSLGDSIAAWVRENRKALGVSEVIWQQRIWTAERSGDGWRPMSDRGSATANHYDHVHVTVYGNAGTS